MNKDNGSNGIEIMQDFGWVTEPVPWPLWVWAALFSAVFLVITGAAWYLLIFRARTRKPVESAPEIPAHLTALEALKRLRESVDGMDELDFVIEVSRILRAYLQERFRLRAPHRATEEFLYEASESAQFTADQQQLLGRFLSRCDMIKFAQRRHVALEKMKALLETTQTFVESTSGTVAESKTQVAPVNAITAKPSHVPAASRASSPSHSPSRPPSTTGASPTPSPL